MYTIIKFVTLMYIGFGHRGCNSNIGCMVYMSGDIVPMSGAIVRMSGGCISFYMCIAQVNVSQLFYLIANWLSEFYYNEY